MFKGVVGLVAAIPVHAIAGSFTFTLLPAGSFATAVNANGVVVGGLGGEQATAFVWQNGTLTKVNAGPNAQLTAVNAAGLAVGDFGNNPNLEQGFTYDIATGAISDFAIDVRKSATFPTGINSTGEIAGYYTYHKHHLAKGFLLNDGKTTELLPKGAFGAEAVAINDAGIVAGTFLGTNGGEQSFLYANRKYTLYSAPGASSTYASAISAGGAIAGTAYFSSGQISSSGFVFDGTNTNFYNVPGEAATALVGFGPGDELAGNFNLPNNVSHGFVYTAGQYYHIDPPSSTSTVITGINADGSLVGFCFPNGGAVQAFIAQCPSGQAPCTQ